ncbi:MAG: hypothetical protein IJ059_03895 [Prevotella sp.]|nr:hypothetical protein [Prevotella sp.]
MEQAWTFIRTLGKGVVQGIRQYIDNDLQDQLPLIVIAAVLIVAMLLSRIIRKINNK